MKTNAQRREKIISKMRELSEIRGEREQYDGLLMSAEGEAYYKAVAAVCELNTIINRKKAGIIRMIKRLITDIYGEGWGFSETEYYEYVTLFKKFAC